MNSIFKLFYRIGTHGEWPYTVQAYLNHPNCIVIFVIIIDDDKVTYKVMPYSLY